MTEHEQIEQHIRSVLAAEIHAITLSQKLFSPDGLFNQLARTEEERRAVARTPLFKEALRRLGELERQEIEAFGRAIRQAQAVVPEGGCLFKLERA